MRTLKILAIAAAALGLSACASIHRLDAANDVHTLLVSIRDDDRTTFDAHVDRVALQAEIERKLTERANKAGGDGNWKIIGQLLAPTIAQIAGDNLIQPQVFRTVAEHYGYKAGAPVPGALAIASSLKALDDGRVCATRKKDGPCLLIFTQEQGTWRLSGFEGDVKELRTKL
jgi:hypothetical protein